MRDPVPRTQLAALLDALEDRRALWVSGPPGAGKTMAVGHWLQVRRASALWYRVDAGDRDPASFFDHLTALANAEAPARAPDLPYHTAEVAGDVVSFARQYFRRWFGSQPAGRTLVLDDVHEAADETFELILREAVAEVPPGCRLIVISRTELPTGLQRSVVSGELARLGWDALRLSMDETREFIARWLPELADRADTIHERTGGWIAGLVLFLSAGGGAEGSCNLEDMGFENTFDYFAGEILSKWDPEVQILLESCSVYRDFSASMAEALHGVPNVPDLLGKMQRHNQFTERLRGPEPRYRFHDLFRNFLRARARKRLGEPGWRLLSAKAGNALAAQGSWEDAIPLLVAGGATSAVARIVLEHAATLLARGRHQSLSEWMSALPEQQVRQSSWLLLWFGRARIRHEFRVGAGLLQDAYGLFEAEGDSHGAMTTCVAVVEAFLLEWNAVESMDAWIARLQGHLGTSVGLRPGLEIEATRVLARALLARQPASPALAAVVRAMERRVLGADVNADSVADAAVVVDYCRFMGDDDRAFAMLRRIDSGSPADVHVATAVAAWWERTATFWYRRGDFDEARRRYDHALAICDEHGLRAQAFLTLLGLALTALSENRLDTASARIGRMREILDPRQAVHVMSLRYAELWLAIQSGDEVGAHTLWDGFSRSAPVGIPLLAAFNHAAVWILCRRGYASVALDRIRGWRESLAGLASPVLEFNFLAMEAYALLHLEAEVELSTSLCAFFSLGARNGYVSLLTWIPQMVAALCDAALSRGIEPEYVLSLISTRGIAAPRHAYPDWPRPLAIRALGEFRILESGHPKRFARKPPRKPLALLKAIIAAGRVGLTTGDAAEMLWPDLDGDAAADALNVAVYRLRGLLGGKGAVRLSDGRLTLNEEDVWVDALAFESLGATRGDAASGLSLYGGALLASEPPDFGVGTARTRLAAKFLRLVDSLGSDLEKAGEWRQALELYGRGIAAEPLSEALHRGVMRCHRHLGQVAEALEAYRRLRDAMRLSLGTEPCRETTGLAEALRRDAALATGFADTP